uniref:Amidase domain-containing protein n=1 Tax=Romanomermis culicivorax TaxID=13658 RepID=A0A915JVT9_ROMCU
MTTNLKKFVPGRYVQNLLCPGMGVGWFEAVPSCQRAVEIAVAALKDDGYELAKFSVPDTWVAFRLAVKALFSDNQQGWLESMNYEDVDDSVKTNYKLAKTPLFLRKCLSKIISLKWPMEGHALGSYVENLNDLRFTFADIKKYRGDFVQSLVDQGIDAIVCPAFTFPAIPPSWCTDLSAAFFYTCIYNLLDLPAGVVPVTHVSPQDIEQLAYYPRSILNGQKTDSLPFSRAPFYSYIRRAVEEAGTGLPVDVQVVSLPFREEHCLKIMAQIEKCVDFKQFEKQAKGLVKFNP